MAPKKNETTHARATIMASLRVSCNITVEKITISSCQRTAREFRLLLTAQTYIYVYNVQNLYAYNLNNYYSTFILIFFSLNFFS